jgi:crotonobetainyl-CoA:carnitine CoA-transferase CaiB-like acyl-CoA transferase
MPNRNTKKMALEGIRVLDLSRVLAGPSATQMLADLGADVVKVESTVSGDDTRSWGPPFIHNSDGSSGEAAYFACANRNKRSITIDFSKPLGASLICELSRKADIIVENFKVGGLKKYGLDYDSIKEINPKIIYCSITGFGQDGPYAHRLGYDFLIQGMGGLMSVTGQPSGAAGGEPMKVGVAICDLFTGLNAGSSILAALHFRNETGKGQHIDCALLDNQISMLANQASNWLNGQVAPVRMGNSHPNVIPYRVFSAADGHIIITCGNDQQFKRLCSALDISNLSKDPRFMSNEARLLNREALEHELQEIIETKKKKEIIQTLEKFNVPCGPINTIPEVFSDSHVRFRETEVEMSRTDGTVVKTVAFPGKLSESPVVYRKPPPTLGEHTNEVLLEWVNMSEKELQNLKNNQII